MNYIMKQASGNLLQYLWSHCLFFFVSFFFKMLNLFSSTNPYLQKGTHDNL